MKTKNIVQEKLATSVCIHFKQSNTSEPNNENISKEMNLK